MSATGRLQTTLNFSRNGKNYKVLHRLKKRVCRYFVYVLTFFSPSLLINCGWGCNLKGPDRSMLDEKTAVRRRVCARSKWLHVCNKSRGVKSKRKGGKQWRRRGETRWIFIPLTIQKYNSTIVNWGMYISLGNTENCNKCISAFVYTFQSKELQTLSYWFLLHWHDERVGTRLACFQLQVNVDIWKLATWDI